MKLTKIIKIFIPTLLFVLVLTPTSVYAWDDCPKGLVNDPYPGECARYIDTDNNGICDHSEPAPEDRVSENTIIDKQITEDIQKPQLAASNSAPASNSTSNNPDNAPTSKPFMAFGLVVFHLVGILIYVTYQKRKLRKA